MILYYITILLLYYDYYIIIIVYIIIIIITILCDFIWSLCFYYYYTIAILCSNYKFLNIVRKLVIIVKLIYIMLFTNGYCIIYYAYYNTYFSRILWLLHSRLKPRCIRTVIKIEYFYPSMMSILTGKRTLRTTLLCDSPVNISHR